MNGTRATLFASVALGGLSLWHALGYMDTFNSPPPEAIAAGRLAPVDVAAPAAPGPRRVVLAVVDGLRLDRARQLGAPFDRAARCTLTAALPTWSRPNYATLATGTPPWLSGVRNNDHVGPAHLTSLFDLARARGWRTALAADGTDWWTSLFPDAFDTTLILPKDAFDAAFDAWTPPPGSLSLVHLVDPDDLAHAEGVGQGYDAAVTRAGVRLARLWARLDPARDTLLVTADHGHLDRGGHGGPEPAVLDVPLVALGAGIAPAASTDCRHPNVDVAPTLAALAALPPPPASLGRPLAPLLDPAAVDLAAAAARTDAQRARLAEALDPEGATPDPLAPPSGGPAWPALAAAALAWLGLGLLLRYVTRRARMADGPRWPFAVRGAAYPLAFVAIYATVEPTLSFSAVWERDPWTLHITALVVAAAAAAWALTWPFNVHLRPRPQRAAGWVLYASTLPWLIAAGAQGSISGGPVLGPPWAAFGLLVADFVVLGGALSALLLLAFDRLRGVQGSMQAQR